MQSLIAVCWVCANGSRICARRLRHADPALGKLDLVHAPSCLTRTRSPRISFGLPTPHIHPADPRVAAIHYAQLRLLSRDELAQYIAHRCAVAGAARTPFDDRSLDALFEIGRGNLRATDDLALKSLDYAAAAGHAAVSVQHIIAARKDLWP